MKFKLLKVMEGHSRVIYKVYNKRRQMIYYCLQEGYQGEISLYRCGLPPNYEPQVLAMPRKNRSELFEKPEGDSLFETHVKLWIDEEVD